MYEMTRGKAEGLVERRMKEVVVSANDVRNVLKKVKRGKQPGPDEIKPEVYKWMLSSERWVL